MPLACATATAPYPSLLFSMDTVCDTASRFQTATVPSMDPLRRVRPPSQNRSAVTAERCTSRTRNSHQSCALHSLIVESSDPLAAIAPSGLKHNARAVYGCLRILICLPFTRSHPSIAPPSRLRNAFDPSALIATLTTRPSIVPNRTMRSFFVSKSQLLMLPSASHPPIAGLPESVAIFRPSSDKTIEETLPLCIRS